MHTITITVSRHFPGEPGDRYGNGKTEGKTATVLDVTLRDADYLSALKAAEAQLGALSLQYRSSALAE